MSKIDLAMVQENYNNKIYTTNNRIKPTGKLLPEYYVFNENESVKWNREEVIKYNKKLKSDIKYYRDGWNELRQKFKEDLFAAIIHDYSEINPAQAKYIIDNISEYDKEDWIFKAKIMVENYVNLKRLED